MLRHPRRRAAALVWLLLLILLAVAPPGALQTLAAGPPELRVVFIDVGDGDAILLRDSSGFDVLIDGGPSGAGTALVSMLRAAGLDDLDVVVATHMHNDHIGGLVHVLRATDIPVERVIYNGYPVSTNTWNNLVDAANARGLTPEAVYFPRQFTWGEMQVHVLNPAPGLSNPDANDASLVLRIDHGQVRFLFPGDIRSGMEAQVLARGTPVAAQVLKVSHHGSSDASSASFLAAVGAREGVISVDKNNSDGRPASQTLQRLADAGVRVWRTDRDGNVTVISDGQSYTISSSKGGPAPTSTPTRTRTPTITRTNTPTRTPTITRTSTPTRTPTITRTNTPTSTSTRTPTITRTNTPMNTSTNTPTSPAASTPTNTATITPTNALTDTPTTAPTPEQDVERNERLYLPFVSGD